MPFHLTLLLYLAVLSATVFVFYVLYIEGAFLTILGLLAILILIALILTSILGIWCLYLLFSDRFLRKY